MCNPVNRPPPASEDLDGWSRAIADDTFSSFRPEERVAALQDLGEGLGEAARNKLALHLSREIMRILRRNVGVNHVDGGKEIVENTHGQIIEAMLAPTSADGRGLREAFAARVKHRMLDAIRAEMKREDRKQKLTDKIKREQSRGAPKRAHVDGVSFVEPDAGEFFDSFEDDREEAQEAKEKRASDDALVKLDWYGSSVDPRDAITEGMDLSCALEKVGDPRKRLAFRLSLEQVPSHSNRDCVLSIAEICKVSEKTARAWIDEVLEVVTVETVGGRK